MNHALVMIGTLRKLCNHPDLFVDSCATAIGKQLMPDDRRVPILARHAASYMSGAKQPEVSGKLAVLSAIVREARACGDKLVIVSNFTQSLDLVQALCDGIGEKCVRLDGSTQVSASGLPVQFSCGSFSHNLTLLPLLNISTQTSKRQKIVDKFNGGASRGRKTARARGGAAATAKGAKSLGAQTNGVVEESSGDVFEAVVKKKMKKTKKKTTTPTSSARATSAKRASETGVFLLSAKAGGVGLNLIGANRLVLLEPDWNPATDEQAMARIWRSGQQKRCYIYRLLMTGTIDEKIFQRQLSKTEVADEIGRRPAAGRGERARKGSGARSTKRNFTPDELRKLFKLHEATVCETAELMAKKRRGTSFAEPALAAAASGGEEWSVDTYSGASSACLVHDGVLRAAVESTAGAVSFCHLQSTEGVAGLSATETAAAAAAAAAIVASFDDADTSAEEDAGEEQGGGGWEGGCAPVAALGCDDDEDDDDEDDDFDLGEGVVSDAAAVVAAPSKEPDEETLASLDGGF